MRKLAEALGSAVEGLMSDPGAHAPTIKTGAVIIAPASSPVPADRKMQVSKDVEARWTPVPMNLEHLSLNELAAYTANGSVPVNHWEISYHATKPDRFASMTAEQFREHCLSLSIAPADDATYSGYYPTIRGSDIAHHDPTKQGMAAFQGGSVIKGHTARDANGTVVHDGTVRGGTEIRGGRAEYRRKTKGYEPMDAGYFAHVDRIKAQQKAERDRKTDIELQKIDAKLPRKVGEL